MSDNRPITDTCPFCDILAGRAPAEIIMRWGVEAPEVNELLEVAAFVPLNPCTPGHLLVVPAVHVPHAAADPDVAAATMNCAADLARTPGLGDYNIITSAGPAATQTVPHLHLHLLPRRDGDGLALPWSPR